MNIADDKTTVKKGGYELNNDYGLLNSVLNRAGTIILVCDVESLKVLYASDNAEVIFSGRKPEDVIGMNCLEALDKTSGAHVIRFTEKLKSRKEYEMEEYFEPQGECWRARGREFEYEGRKVMAHYIYDVTDEHRLRTDLRNRYYADITLMSDVSPYALGMYRLNLSQNTMGIPLGRVPEGMDILHPMNVDVFFRCLAERCGKKADEKSFVNLFDRRTLIREYEQGHTHFSMEHTFFMETDRIMWVATAINMAKNADTGDIEAVLYNVDLFREKIVEELLGAVSDNDYDRIYLIDAKYGRAYELSDIRRNPGRDIREEGVEYKVLLDRLMQRAVKNEDGYLEAFDMLALENIRRELRHRPKYTVYFETVETDGTVRHKEANFYRIDIPGDLICNTIQDISGVVENAVERQAELRYALEKVQTVLNSRNSILARLSRDIRSPLGSIIGYAEIARSEVSDDTKEAGYLDNIISAGSSIRSIIDDMLILHQMDRKGAVLEPEKLDLIDFLGILEAKMLPDAAGRRLLFSVEIGNHVPRQIVADRYRLEQVLTRLLENTFDYNKSGSTVRLRVTEQERKNNRTTLRFSIIDSSTGVNAEYLSTVFEPADPKILVQTDSTEQTDLGLTLVKSYVSAMGGQIEAESLDEFGSCVTIKFTFPVSYDRSETYRRIPSESEKPYKFSGGRVLLVDDHRISLDICVKMIERSGLEVVTAMNGVEAVREFRNAGGTFDLILMDIQMPLMDGLEATRIIRSEKKLGGDRVPIVALTASAYDTDIKISFDAGMNEHLTKPFGPQELYWVISKFIR